MQQPIRPVHVTEDGSTPMDVLRAFARCREPMRFGEASPGPRAARAAAGALQQRCESNKVVTIDDHEDDLLPDAWEGTEVGRAL